MTTHLCTQRLNLASSLRSPVSSLITLPERCGPRSVPTCPGSQLKPGVVRSQIQPLSSGYSNSSRNLWASSIYPVLSVVDLLLVFIYFGHAMWHVES